MRKLFFLGLSLLMIAIYSCEMNQENDMNISTTTEIDGTILPSFKLDKEGLTLERRMQWMAYLSVNVIRFYPEAEAEIVELLEENNTIPVNMLIGDDATEVKFKDAFKTELSYYIVDTTVNLVGRPSAQEDTPPKPIVTKEKDPLEVAIDKFTNYMTEENCIELYFPNKLEDIDKNDMTSTAHPLTEDDSNKGWLRFLKPLDKDYPTKKVEVDDVYVDQNENIIVARPYRDLDQLNCLYDEYDNINFEDFLKN